MPIFSLMRAEALQLGEACNTSRQVIITYLSHYTLRRVMPIFEILPYASIVVAIGRGIQYIKVSNTAILLGYPTTRGMVAELESCVYRWTGLVVHGSR